VKAEIVRLGTTYGLMSRHTSFVAIEKRETPVEGEVQLRKVPVAISTGWHGIESASYDQAFCASPADALPMMAGTRVGAMPRFFESLDAAIPRPPQPPAPDPLDRLLRLQEKDGSWDLTRELATALGLSWRKVEKAFAAAMDDVERRLRLVDRAGQLAGQILQAWATVRTQRQEQELADLLRTELRDIGDPLASIAARIDEAEDALEKPGRRVLSALQELLQFLESFRADGGPKETLRRAFATALALGRLRGRGADARDDWKDAAGRGDEWLKRAPLGARFWLEAVGRSRLLA